MADGIGEDMSGQVIRRQVWSVGMMGWVCKVWRNLLRVDRVCSSHHWGVGLLHWLVRRLCVVCRGHRFGSECGGG